MKSIYPTLRTFSFQIFILLFMFSLSMQPATAQNKEHTTKYAIDTIYVAPPTGEQETDRKNIQSAFDKVQPGGVVQFRPGTYLLGAGARLTVPDVTVQGHPAGTVLRGCDPRAFEVDEAEMASVRYRCTGLYIQAERQTIRGITFEYISNGITVGPSPTTEEEASAFLSGKEKLPVYPVGGQIIEKNIFRFVRNGLKVGGTAQDLSVVRDNDFIDVFHAIGIYGTPIHFLDNRVTVTDPERVPYTRHPGSAVIIGPGDTDCNGHVVAGNHIEGYPDPIYVITGRGETCHGVKILNNTIRAAGVKIPEGGAYIPTEDDSTLVGAPITLMNITEHFPGMPQNATEGVLENIIVRGNKILGGEGLGILVQNVSRSRIEENTISGIQERTPFPGINWDGFEQQWVEANGSGIWVSPGSSGNEIRGNAFENIASYAVFLEGDSTLVEVRKADDSVRDVGKGNIISKFKLTPHQISDTIIVAPPSGQQETDRKNIQSAFDAVKPGGVVQFSPGTYLLGAGARLTVPDVTVLGHHKGTVLRGCNPEAFGVEETQIASVVFGCTGFYIQAERQTIRGLTFEYIWHAIVVGAYPTSEEEASTFWSNEEGPAVYPAGGQLIEKNTFKSVANGLRMLGTGDELSIVRDNDFINVFHAIGIYGGPLHFLQNRITVVNPESVPFSRHPGSAILVSPGLTDCSGHVVAENLIEGYPDPIYVNSDPGKTCQEVKILNNIIRAARVKIPEAWVYKPTAKDSTMVGVPITLMNYKKPMPGIEADTLGVLKNILVQGNKIYGAEGLGILVQNVFQSQILDNTISGIKRRTPFPGINWDGIEHEWEEANGSGIWLSPGSSGNQIVGNTFTDIASAAVFLEGDSNRVKLQNSMEQVQDLGVGNRIRESAGDDTKEADKQDSTHYKSRFIDAGSIRLQYLDFGGDGLPLVFVHSEGWDAYTYANFAPRFTDRNRVLAVTRPGYGEFESHPDGFGMAKQAGALVHFLDALGIERAIFAGNSSPITYLTYLAEHHSDRVAGVIYLAGLMPMWLTEVKNSDPTGAGAMVESARTSDPIARERSRIIDLYRPEFLSGENSQIDVPALAFANRFGLIGYERFSWPLALVGSPLMRDFYKDLPPSPATDYLRRLVDDPGFRNESLSRIQDSIARTFFTHLADDPEQQDEIWRYQQETVRQALVEGQEKFRRAFGNQLRLVPLNVSVIYGYEYRDAPDLIEPHIRSFLNEIKENEQRKLQTSTRSFKDTIRSQDLDLDLDQKIRAHMEKLEIPGVSLAVIREGKILRAKAYGYANLEPEVAATPSTIFPYASMAKVFTGTAILQLVQEGRFSLEDKITQLLPSLPKAWSGVTVRQLLSNTSGLPDMHPDRSIENVRAAAKMSREEILAMLINRKADFAPGENFAYNQTNYLLLGMLIERIDGRSIQNYVEEELAKPQNFDSLHYGGTRDSIQERATWYSRFDISSGNPKADSIGKISSKYPPYLYPAAGLNGTARDLASFVDALASGQFLKDYYKREMWTAVELSNGNIFRFGDSIEGSGLGWWVNDHPEQPYVWMGGGSSGILRHYINENLTVVVLTNLMGSEPEKIADDVAAIYLTRKFKN